MSDLATVTRPTDWPGRFETEYPDATPEGLAWLEEHLGLDRRRMARLTGLSASVSVGRQAAWSAAHTADKNRAEQLEEVLTDLIHLFDYDWTAAAAFLKRPVTPSPPPSPLPLPGDVPADAPLLVAVHTRAAGWTRALADFFGSPTA